MPKTAQIVCDTCGVAKKESNHWWVVRVVDMLHLYTLEWWEERAVDFPDGVIEYFCSVSCTLKRINKFFERYTRFQVPPDVLDGTDKD